MCPGCGNEICACGKPPPPVLVDDGTGIAGPDGEPEFQETKPPPPVLDDGMTGIAGLDGDPDEFQENKPTPPPQVGLMAAPFGIPVTVAPSEDEPAPKPERKRKDSMGRRRSGSF